MKVLKTAFVILAMISQITVYASYAPSAGGTPTIEPKIELYCVGKCKDEVTMLLEKKTQGWSNYDVSVLDKIIFCESGYNTLAHASTTKENSWGIAQINLIAHPNVSKEQATDISFALDFLIENYKQGNAPAMWYTCYNRATS